MIAKQSLALATCCCLLLAVEPLSTHSHRTASSKPSPHSPVHTHQQSHRAHAQSYFEQVSRFSHFLSQAREFVNSSQLKHDAFRAFRKLSRAMYAVELMTSPDSLRFDHLDVMFRRDGPDVVAAMLNLSDNVTSRCVSDVGRVIVGLSQRESWAIQSKWRGQWKNDVSHIFNIMSNFF